MQIDTDVLLIITSTADELSGGTNVVVVVVNAWPARAIASLCGDHD